MQANPLKVVLGMTVNSVVWIFYGRTGKEHLQLSMKSLHTRAFGQFATLSSMSKFLEFVNLWIRQHVRVDVETEVTHQSARTQSDCVSVTCHHSFDGCFSLSF